MTVKVNKIGPGTLTVGATGTEVDWSCQISTAQVEWDKSADDPVTTLCGDVAAGAVTYTAKLTGTALQDLDDAEGMVAFSWANKGTEQAFVFIPSTEAGATVTGVLVVDPLTVGGEVKTNGSSDFEWDCVGEPTIDGFGTVIP